MPVISASTAMLRARSLHLLLFSWSDSYSGLAGLAWAPPGIFGVPPCYRSCSTAYFQLACISHAACCRANIRPF